MLEVATAVRAEHSLHTEEFDITTSSHHSDDSSAGEKADNLSPVAYERPASPNDYTPTYEVQTSGGDEGNLDLYRLTREVLRLKKQNTKQAAQILRLKTKIKILVKNVKPLIAKYKSFGRKKVSVGSTGLNEVDEGSAQANEGTFEDFKGTAQANEGTAEVNESTVGANLSTAEINESTVGANLSTAEVNESTVEANLSTEPSMKEVE
ncbi:hypothetical protein Tco_0119763, partial [Tanacetum coccineum]